MEGMVDKNMKFKKGQKVRITVENSWFPKGTICTIRQDDTFMPPVMGLNRFGEEVTWFVEDCDFEILPDEYSDTKGGETMAITTKFKKGDKLVMIPGTTDGECRCGNLREQFQEGKCDYIVLNEEPSVDGTGLNWTAFKETRITLSHCCTINLAYFECVTPPQSIMTKLTTIAKKLLDADTKALVKAGILDSELQITEDGEKFLLAQYLTDNKKALATEAQKIIDEQKDCK